MNKVYDEELFCDCCSDQIEEYEEMFLCSNTDCGTIECFKCHDNELCYICEK